MRRRANNSLLAGIRRMPSQGNANSRKFRYGRGEGRGDEKEHKGKMDLSCLVGSWSWELGVCVEGSTKV